MPIATATTDVVLFLNSLHHVRKKNMKAALSEASRVLQPEGHVVVVEPVLPNDGSAYAQLLGRGIGEDKEIVEAERALRAFTELPKGLYIESEAYARTEREYAGYDEWRDAVILADKSRRRVLEQRDGELRALFLEAATFRSRAAVVRAKARAAASAAERRDEDDLDADDASFDEFGVRRPISDEEVAEAAAAAETRASAAYESAAGSDDDDDDNNDVGVYVLLHYSKVYVLRQVEGAGERDWWTVEARDGEGLGESIFETVQRARQALARGARARARCRLQRCQCATRITIILHIQPQAACPRRPDATAGERAHRKYIDVLQPAGASTSLTSSERRRA